MMNTDLTYDVAIKNAAALKALGQTDVYLFHDKERPWHIVKSCKAGCSIRLGIPVSLEFSGEQDGISFRWSFDLERTGSNGTGTTKIDVDACKDVLDRLHGDALVQFRECIANSIDAVKKQGAEWQEIADKQFRDAAVLRDLLNHHK